jgi:ComF family protein
MALINDFMSLIYPRRCEACGDHLFKHEKFICNYCQLNLPTNNYHLDPENRLVQVLAGRVPLVHGLCFYLFEKSGKVQKLLHAIKYQDQKELGEYLGKMYATSLLNANCTGDIDLVLPVPLHHNKLKVRGYNQSEWYARGLASTLNRQLDVDSLVRIKETATQTKKKKYQRWENVDGIFELKAAEKLEHKHVLLVDDVVTTGATIEAAWQVLKPVKGLKISVASIAFAPLN